MPDFDRAQNTATLFLLQQNLSSLYIDVRNFKLPPNTFIESMQNFCSMTGASIEDLRAINEGACLLRQAGSEIILYDDEISNEQRKHWGIIHELGHAFLGHPNDSRAFEIEAHFFAAQVVSPEIVLWDICKRKGSLSDSDLYLSFNMSYEAASKRIQTMKRRQRYNSGDIDKQLLQKFKPILDAKFPAYRHVS